MTQAQAVQPDLFSSDGRGPQLGRLHWRTAGSPSLAAIDYSNAAVGHGTQGDYHVRVVGCQAIMITPEEVIGDRQLPDNLSDLRPAALFDLGRSEWLMSFNQTHLSRCRHYQLLFYDELVDIICDAIEIHEGSFAATDAA